MPADETLRAFLLGMSEQEAMNHIEEGILDGSISADGLLLVEEELIDDYVFGRLSPDEVKHFEARFLVDHERRNKIRFSRSIHEHALNQGRRASAPVHWSLPRISSAAPSPATRRPLSPGFAGASWRFALVAVLVSFVIATAWLELRTIRLSRELAESARVGDERARLLASIINREKQLAGETGPADRSITKTARSAAAGLPQPEPEIRLTPGVERGIERLPVLHLTGHFAMARLTLEVPFKPEGAFREELFRSNGERIWSQEFSSADSVVTHGITTIDLPAKLLAPGDYQLKFKVVSPVETSSGGANYVFRVSGE
jgi:hypothetical protein